MRSGEVGGLRIRDAKPRRLCGGRPRLFCLADEARRGEPSNMVKGACCGRSRRRLVPQETEGEHTLIAAATSWKRA
jgi:hypothetical protein